MGLHLLLCGVAADEGRAMTDHKHELTMLSCPECLRQAQAELAEAEKERHELSVSMVVARRQRDAAEARAVEAEKAATKWKQLYESDQRFDSYE